MPTYYGCIVIQAKNHSWQQREDKVAETDCFTHERL